MSDRGRPPPLILRRVARRARWCEYCEAVVPSEKDRDWRCLRCESLTYPLLAVKTAGHAGAALGWTATRPALGFIVLGLALGTLVSVTTDIPLAPEGGLVLGGLVAWLWRLGEPR